MRSRRAPQFLVPEPSETNSQEVPPSKEVLMQILHRFVGSIQQYLQQISDPDICRPDHCPLCGVLQILISWGVYHRTLVDLEFDGSIPVRRYRCRFCRRTVSVLPEFVLPYLRFSLLTISLFLVARLLNGGTLEAAAQAASQPNMPYQRGQFWIRRFRTQAMALCSALVSRTAAISAATFVTRALQMLQKVGWIPAHCFLFSELRFHLLGWPRSLAPAGIACKLQPVEAKT
jgi:hypothetical protein